VAFVELAERDDLAPGRKPVDAELGADGVRDRACDLDFEAGLGRLPARERRIRGIRTQPNLPSLTVAARGRDQEGRDRERERDQSVSPNTTMMSP